MLSASIQPNLKSIKVGIAKTNKITRKNYKILFQKKTIKYFFRKKTIIYLFRKKLLNTFSEKKL